MRTLDLLAYLSVLGMTVLLLFSAGTRDADAPPAPPNALEEVGIALAPPSPFDEQVLIQVARPQDGVGTAFSINSEGYWLTARHVVEGCEHVGLFVRPGNYVPARSVEINPRYDLALLKTDYAPNPVTMSLDSVLRVGTEGYHVGFPQGKPGEAVAQLHSRSSLISSGERQGREPVLAWSELGRTRGLEGSLGGLSGGPVYDRRGIVRGVILAESPRRGRIYTAAPSIIKEFLNENGVEYGSNTAVDFNLQDYGEKADGIRRSGQVVKVACRVRS
ncbi:MAG: serine protease [Pseudomonadota bacterium]